MSKDDLIREQASTIVHLQAVISNLRKEKKSLEQALQRDFKIQKRKFDEISDKLAMLERPILEVVIELAKHYQRPVSYKEIVKAVSTKYQHISNPSTIQRTVRKLREKGYLVKHGTDRFYPDLTHIQGRN